MGSIEVADVIVLGGGFAGLSAACALSSRGARVIVLEKKPRLGGRASSFFDTRLDLEVDNGQHLFMGCYRHTQAFLRRIGASELIDFPKQVKVHYADANGGRFALACPSWLRSPYHLLVGVLGLGGLSLMEKWPLAYLGSWFRKNIANGHFPRELDQVTIAQWLDSLKQPKELQERFYFPIALGALNEDPHRASALGFAQVLKEAFFSGRDATRLGLAKVALGRLYTEQAQGYIVARGGQVCTNQRVRALDCNGALIVTTDQGLQFQAKVVISALTPWDLSKLQLPGVLAKAPWRTLEASPIIGINLLLDRSVFEQPFVGLLGTEIQWAFNRSRLWALPGNGQSLALVISGAHRQLRLSPEELLAIGRRDLLRCFPNSEKANIVRWSVVKEPYATLSPVVGSDALRPEPNTEVPGFYLAGDWTQTHLPATIESAVKSGHRAAELVEAS